MVADRVMTRFFRYVEKTPDCWLWRGASVPRGYGRFYFNGKPRYAHRVSVELAGGTVPSGSLVMHRCDNPACVNPDHLVVGTQADNMKDCARKGRVVCTSDWRGTKNPKAKLSEADRLEVDALIADGYPTQFISQRFGITQVRVQQIAREAQKRGGGWLVEEF